jgi:hypothetical protein
VQIVSISVGDGTGATPTGGGPLRRTTSRIGVISSPGGSIAGELDKARTSERETDRLLSPTATQSNTPFYSGNG